MPSPFRWRSCLLGFALWGLPASGAAAGCPEGGLPLTDLVGALATVPAEGLELHRFMIGMDRLSFSATRGYVQSDAAGFAGGSLARLSEPALAGEPSSGVYAESSSLFGGGGIRTAVSLPVGTFGSVGGMAAVNALYFRDGALGATLTTAAPLCAVAGPISVAIPRISLNVQRMPLDDGGLRTDLRLLPGVQVGVFQPAGPAWVALRGALSSSLTSIFQSEAADEQEDTIAASVEVLAYHRAIVPQLPGLISSRVGVQAVMVPVASEPVSDGPQPALATSGWTWTSRTQLALAPRLDRTVQLGGALELELGWLPDQGRSTGGGGKLWLALTPSSSLQLLLAVRARALQVVTYLETTQQYSSFDWSATALYSF